MSYKVIMTRKASRGAAKMPVGVELEVEVYYAGSRGSAPY